MSSMLLFASVCLNHSQRRASLKTKTAAQLRHEAFRAKPPRQLTSSLLFPHAPSMDYTPRKGRIYLAAMYYEEYQTIRRDEGQGTERTTMCREKHRTNMGPKDSLQNVSRRQRRKRSVNGIFTSVGVSRISKTRSSAGCPCLISL